MTTKGFVGEGPDEGLNGACNGITLVLHSVDFETLNKKTGVWEPDLDAYEFFGVTPPASQKAGDMNIEQDLYQLKLKRIEMMDAHDKATNRQAFWLLLGVNLIVWARVGLVLLEMVK